MKHRMLSIILVCCLLAGVLGGCGSAPAAESVPSEVASSEAVSAVEEGSAQEPASVEEPEEAEDAETPAEPEEAEEQIPEDPAELGAWIWNLAMESGEDLFAEDEDTDITVRTTIDGEEYTVAVNGRVKLIVGEDDSYTIQMDTEQNNIVQRIWYEDGMGYISDDYGNRKAAISQEDFEKKYLNDGNGGLENMEAKDFETLTGEVTDGGYQVTYDDFSMDTWELFSYLFDDLEEYGESVEPDDFRMSGVMTVDQKGNLIRNELTLYIEYELMGTPVQEELEIIDRVNSYNETVNISVPRDDSSYVLMSDLDIPEVFVNGVNTLLTQMALSYADEITITVSGAENFTEVEQDTIAYMIGVDGLSARWDMSYFENGTFSQWYTDIYSGGEGVYSDASGDEPYSYSDEEFGTDIADFITFYVDSFDYGSDHTMEIGEQGATITWNISSEYIEAVIYNYSENLGVVLEDADDAEYSGTMTIRLDADGMVVEQTLECLAELTYGVQSLTITLVDHGEVTGVNEDVVVDLS